MIHIKTAKVVAIFQFVDLASASNDARLITGPANNSATAAPAGAPAARRPSANGISKNVGKAIGTAIDAVAMTARERKLAEAIRSLGTYSISSIEQITPSIRAGVVRITTPNSERRNRGSSARCGSLDRCAGMLSGKSRSMRMPLKSTAGAAIRRRAAATFGANIIKVRTSAAGFNAGEASITASDGPSLVDRSYTAVKTDATQHEHNISGAPAAADMS